MAHHRLVEGFGYVRYFHPVRDAPGAQQIDHHNVHGLLFQHVAKRNNTVVVFARRDGQA